MLFSSNKNYILPLFILFIFLTSQAFAQNPTKWTLESDAKGKTLKANESLKAKLKTEIEDGWHLYAVEQPDGGPFPTKISVPENSSYKIDDKISSPAAISKLDPNFNIETRYFEKTAEFDIPLKATQEFKGDDLKLEARFQVCNDTTCLPPKTVRISFAGFEDTKKALTSTTTPSSEIGNIQPQNEQRSINSANSVSSVNPVNSPNSDNSLWSFIWLALSAGALSLLTPCVFPMIPITVSYFTNHAGKSRANSIKLATVYSLGIIATFTILGMLLAVLIGAAGVQIFSANPWINLGITAIFLFFAFNLFGAYEISVPTSVLTKLDNLTRSKEGEGSGVVGALLMGLTFTLTSFTCTSPFIGSIMVSSANGNWQTPLLGMLAFSTVFALPFFILALVPQYISSLPRAGGWMNSVKVAMGFLEVAAAMKFISNVDLIWKWGIFTRSFVLAIWIAIGIILSTYLLGKFQLFHDSKPEKIGAVRLMSSILSLAISFYLLTGLFGARLGTLESFLPPETETSKNFFNKSSGEQLDWKKYENNLEAAITRAKAENKKVFIDFTGYTCTNCRWMEANVFTRSDVEAEMSKYILVRLYTDDGSENNTKQQEYQEKNFQTVALPFYAVLDGTGQTVSTFPGLTRNTTDFVDFLQKAEKN